MIAALRQYWKVYLIEAWALGMFMVSACLFTILLEHPALPFRAALDNAFVRRAIAGAAMGVTAVLLIYSRWGKLSGAHMNPAVTIAHLQMERMTLTNAAWYILFQFAGGALGVGIFHWTVPDLMMSPGVNYAVTIPGAAGSGAAFTAEFIISFLLLISILVCSNSRYADYTGYLAGILVALFITFEGPFSGMSINPARTFASALPAGIWTAWWIYLLAPVGGMLLAGITYRRWYRNAHQGNCLTMKCHLSGNAHGCPTYDVLGPGDLLDAPVAPGDSGRHKNHALLPM